MEANKKQSNYNPEFMREAIRIAVENVKNHAGGPFGAVVVKDGPHVPGCHLLGSPGTGVLRLHERRCRRQRL